MMELHMHAEAAKLLAEYGPNELVEKKTSKLVIYLKLLVAPMPIMIWIAIFVEVGITIANAVTEGSPGTNWIDAIILLAIQFLNQILQVNLLHYHDTKFEVFLGH